MAARVRAREFVREPGQTDSRERLVPRHLESRPPEERAMVREVGEARRRQARPETLQEAARRDAATARQDPNEDAAGDQESEERPPERFRGNHLRARKPDRAEHESRPTEEKARARPGGLERDGRGHEPDEREDAAAGVRRGAAPHEGREEKRHEEADADPEGVRVRERPRPAVHVGPGTEVGSRGAKRLDAAKPKAAAAPATVARRRRSASGTSGKNARRPRARRAGGRARET